MFKVKEGLKLFNNQTKVRYPTGNYGSFEIDGGAKGSWEGFSIGGRAVFMHDNGTATGIYNDVDNEWMFLGYRNAQVQLYYDGSNKFQTTSSGAQVNGLLDIRGNLEFDGTATTTNQSRGIVWTGFDKEGTTDFSDNAHIKHITNSGGLAGSVLEIKSMNDSNDGVNFNVNSNTGVRIKGNPIFHDAYHPNADKWTTARTNTVTLTGDASGSGSASVDGTGNWTVSVPVTVADDSHNHNHSDGDFSVGSNLTASRYFQRATGTPTNNLGDPTITEMALFDSQFNNKTEFYPTSALKFYQTTDGTNWTEITTYSDDQKKRFLHGDANSSVVIPNLAQGFRIEVESQGYVFLNALYMYWSSNSHSTKVHVYRRRNSDGAWLTTANSSVNVSSWPGHLYLPFNTITFNPSNSSQHNKVRIEFIPNWSGHATYGDRDINLYSMQLWGGYPAGRRNVYYTDQDHNVDFPAEVKGSSFNADTEIKINGTTVIDSSRNLTNIGTAGFSGRLKGTNATTGLLLGDFTSSNSDEWPKVTWLRDTANNWDEGLMKASSSRGVFGRQHFGIHFDDSRSFAFHSSSWDTEMEISGDGRTYIKGNLGIGITPTTTSEKLGINGSVRVYGAGNSAGGNIKLGESGEGSNKWSIITGAHYNDTSQSKGFTLIGGLSLPSENKVVIGGNIYESNPCTSIEFWGHTATTHATGGTMRAVLDSGGFNLKVGSYEVNGTTVIDSSRNLTNINNITHTGAQYWNGHIYWGASKNIYVQSGECSFDVSTSAQWRVWDATNSIDAIKVTGGSQVEIGEAGARGLKVFGSIIATGNVTAYSDERLKDNIKTLDGSKVYQMRGVSFTKNGEAGSGVIAQELEKVAPELVMTNDDEMKTKSVAYGNVVGYLIETCKEQNKRIEQLEKLVQQLLEK